MRPGLSLTIATALAGLVPAPARAQWNAANDEANRQSMMAEMRASAAANDRANEESQRRFNDNAARSSASSSSGGSSNYSGSSGGGGATGTGSGSYRDAGPRSIVKSYTFTMHRQETPAALAARLEQEAGAGNALSAYNLGRLYYTGFDALPRNDAKARAWFGTAAKLGHPGAQTQYGAMLYNGVGGAADPAAAMPWLRKAADQGDSYGQALYGFWTLADQVRINPDVQNPEAVAMLVKAADAGQLVAQAYLGGSVYRLGLGTAVDHDKAAHYARLAADQGFAQAQTDLGRDYIYGSGVAKDDALAVTWLRRAAAQNNAEAVFLLGRLAIVGGGLPQDAVGGARTVKQAADAGNMEAIGFYGLLLQQGVGVPRDEVAGAAMLARAADSHDPGAEQNYAIALFNGSGVAQDVTAGVAWQKRAADDGDIDAIATYAVRLSTGQGVAKDVVAGVRYARHAAALGNARGQACLGWAYHDGAGVPKDLAQALVLFRQAAAQGDQGAIDALKQPEMVAQAARG